MFGGQVESALGARPFVFYYLVCLLTAAAAQLAVVTFFTHGYYPTLGASGGVFGVMLAFASLFPQARIIGFPFFVPIPAWFAVILYGGLELFYGVTGTQEGVAHFAHLGGMVGGWVLIQYWRGRLPIKPRRTLR
jgi:membrane associated rhomboid family serine protease